MEQEVTLMEMLEAREARARRQRELLDCLSCPVVSFTMNIPGPVKNGPVIRRAFREGLLRLDAALDAPGLGVVSREEIDLPTGCEALWAVRGPGRQIKELCAAIEDRDPLGRLFDLDVLDPEQGGWSREDLGLSLRRCLVCGREGKGCASRRLHSVEELQEKTREILTGFFARQDREALAGQAARALMYEVCTTPKPGLVDRHNNGSHRDMDLFTFLDSTTALLPYWHQAVSIGQETAGPPPGGNLCPPPGGRAGGGADHVPCHRRGKHPQGGRFLSGLRPGGRRAAVDPGGALPGRRAPAGGVRPDVRQCSRGSLLRPHPGNRPHLRGPAVSGNRTAGDPGRGGRRLPLRPGNRSAHPPRPAAGGRQLERAGISVLLALMARTSDTNLIARGGPEGQRWAAAQAAELLAQSPLPALEAVEALDREMIRRNLSPGGCADLLAVTYFLHFLSQNSAM